MRSLPSRDRIPALVVLVVAVALVCWSAWLVYADFRPDYALTVTETTDATGAGATVLEYDDLSPAARAAFDRARGTTYVVHDRPAYLDTFPRFDTTYVRYDGTVYEVWASSDGLVGLSLFLAVPAVALGAVLAALGAWSYRTERVRLPTTVVAMMAAGAAAALLWPLSGPLFVGALPIVPVAVAAAVVGAGSWVGLGRSGIR